MLAILIKGYTTAMEFEEAQSASIFRDLIEIFSHELQRLVKVFRKDYLFISNDEIVHRLSAEFGDSSFDKVFARYNQITLVGMTQIMPKPGIVMNAIDVHRVLKEYFPQLVFSIQSTEELLVHPILRGIMTRYGKMPESKLPTEIREETRRLFLKKMQLESFRLALAGRDCTREAPLLPKTQILDSCKECRTHHLSAVGLPLNSVGLGPCPLVLSVVIERMRNLPKMDLFRGVDAFCFIFFDGAPGLFQTEVRRGLSEEDWTWNPELSLPFQWTLPSDSELVSSEHKIVVMVYDKDQVSSDDLIGCVSVGLDELQDGVFDDWKRIIRPPDAWRTEYLFWTPPIPELRMRVTLLPHQCHVEKDFGIVHDTKVMSAKPMEHLSSSPAQWQECSIRDLQTPAQFSATSSLTYPLQVPAAQDCTVAPHPSIGDWSDNWNRTSQGLGGQSLHGHNARELYWGNGQSGLPHPGFVLGTVPHRSTLEVQIDNSEESIINHC